ncbi:MAG: hypothetical protein HC807_05820 [Gammaproteobacteria bacterium]|nr:hypothetical protein [Gammaproteobacteria bacterium]
MPVPSREALADLGYQVELISLRIEALEQEAARRMQLLSQLAFTASAGDGGQYEHLVPGQETGRTWRITAVDPDGVTLVSGGEVVGDIPRGLPVPELPRLDMEVFAKLFASALVISLVGFMEAISIAKAITIRTRARLDPNQELIGQGLANLVGSCTQCYPASGSFSRSALNFSAGRAAAYRRSWPGSS